MLVFDIETDGLLGTVSKVHCINAIDTQSGVEYRFTDHEHYQHVDGTRSVVRTPRSGCIADGLGLLTRAAGLSGHNIIGYDIPVLHKLFGFRVRDEVVIRDTQVMAEVMFPDIKERDFAALRKGKLPADFQVGYRPHSLKAWGVRVGGHQKADFDPKYYDHTWATCPFLQDMDEYCMDDVRTNVDVLKHFLAKEWSDECLDMEMEVKAILSRQEQHGFLFDSKAAEELVKELQKKHIKLEAECREVFLPWFAKDGALKKPKRTMKRWVAHALGAHERKGERGYYSHTYKDCEHQGVVLKLFNPGSRQQIANRLMAIHGWEPKEFTESGLAQVDESILAGLTYPEAKKIAEYMTVDKRIGQIATGKQAWLKKVKDDGRLHGRVRTNGTITGRMSHSDPNVAQVPRVGNPYGVECRALFIVPPGRKLVGCDADGLELRMLAHYMARYDGGEYARAVVEGKKEEGTDAHSLNRDAIGLRSRDSAKTWIYAFLYGAGNLKLGMIYVDDMSEEKRDKFHSKYPEGTRREKATAKLGARSRSRMASRFPALKKLIEAVKDSARRGYLVGLDGRKVYVRSQHAALNTLLQSAGAIVMKRALVIMDTNMKKELTHGEDYEFVANVHDEVQIEVAEEHAETVGRHAAEGISLAGESFNLRAPLAGSYDVGDNWAATH